MPRKLNYICLACEAIFVVQYMTDKVLSGLKIAKLIFLKKKRIITKINLTMNINKYTMIIV